MERSNIPTLSQQLIHAEKELQKAETALMSVENPFERDGYIEQVVRWNNEIKRLRTLRNTFPEA